MVDIIYNLNLLLSYICTSMILGFRLHNIYLCRYTNLYNRNLSFSPYFQFANSIEGLRRKRSQVMFEMKISEVGMYLVSIRISNTYDMIISDWFWW